MEGWQEPGMNRHEIGSNGPAVWPASRFTPHAPRLSGGPGNWLPLLGPLPSRSHAFPVTGAGGFRRPGRATHVGLCVAEPNCQ